MLGRDVARLLYDAGWVQVTNLVRMLCTVWAESNLYDHAWHYNSPNEGGDGSTDWGIFQLNDGNKGGKTPISGPDGLPRPVAGGSKPLAEVQAFADMACDPVEAVKHARAMYETRGFQPWAAYNSGAWKKYGPQATYAIRNMLHVFFGWPLTS
jgi:hypothetical protein